MRKTFIEYTGFYIFLLKICYNTGVFRKVYGFFISSIRSLGNNSYTVLIYVPIVWDIMLVFFKFIIWNHGWR